MNPPDDRRAQARNAEVWGKGKSFVGYGVLEPQEYGVQRLRLKPDPGIEPSGSVEVLGKNPYRYATLSPGEWFVRETDALEAAVAVAKLYLESQERQAEDWASSAEKFRSDLAIAEHWSARYRANADAAKSGVEAMERRLGEASGWKAKKAMAQLAELSHTVEVDSVLARVLLEVFGVKEVHELPAHVLERAAEIADPVPGRSFTVEGFDGP